MLDLHHDHDNLEGVWALKLARLKKMLTCGGGPSKYREKPLLHLKDTRRCGWDESSETAELRAFFVAIPQRPIRCQREHLSYVHTPT